MSTMNMLTERLGMPNLHWPKHEGHLNHKERIALVAFLACNGFTQSEIMSLRNELDIVLRDKKAEKAWESLAKKLTTNEKYRRDYKAYSLLHRAYVSIDQGIVPMKQRPIDFIFD